MFNLITVCNILGLFIGLYVATFMLVAPSAQPFLLPRTSMVDERRWTAQDLGGLARTDKLAAAVKRLTSAVRSSGAAVLEAKGIEGVVDAASDVDIRIALLRAADGKDDRKKDPLAAFARTDNAAVTCGAWGTAGGDGLNICVERCERKPSWLDMRTPRSGACYMLCSHAIAPCVEGLFSLGTSAKNWGVPQERWMTRAKKQVVMKVMKMFSALDVLSVWIFAGVDALLSSNVFMLLLVVALAKEVWIYKWNVEEKEKMDMDEVKRIKIMQLFKIRGRLLKKEGMHAFHNFGAWAIYHDSVKAAKAQRQKAGCRLLGGLVSGRRKRAMATRFERWKGAAAAATSAAVDPAPSKADANEGEDEIAG